MKKCNAITLSGLLKDNGYTTISNGKVSHHSSDMNTPGQRFGTHPQEVTWRNYKLEENIKNEKSKKDLPAYERLRLMMMLILTGQIATKTIADLIKLKDDGKPFLFSWICKTSSSF